MMTVSPPLTSEVMLPSPTTAGIPMARATMAVWLVRPPTSVANPFTWSRSSAAVCDGSRSWAITTTSLGQVEQVFVLLADQRAQDAAFDVVNVLHPLGQVPVGHRQKRLAYRRMTVLTAYSAVVWFLWISSVICAGWTLSRSIPMWKSKMPRPNSLPAWARKRFAELAEIGDAVGNGPSSRSISRGDLLGIDLSLGNQQILGIQHDSRADHHTGGNANALLDFHAIVRQFAVAVRQ